MRNFKSICNNKPLKTMDALQEVLYKVHHHKHLERHMRKYHSMVDTYKNKTNDMDDLQYKNLEWIVKGVTQVYNDSDVKLQKIIKLTWWDDKKYTDEVVADVRGVGELTLRHAKEVILKRVTKAVDYV